MLALVPRTAAAAETVASIVEDQRVNGYASKSRALSRLQTASDKPSSSASLQDRYRYYAALGQLAADAEQTEPLQIARTQLASMGQQQRCRPCALEVLLLDAEIAVRHKQAARTLATLKNLPAPSTMELRQAQRFALVRAQLADMQGQNAQAIEHAIHAEQLAHQTGNVRAVVNAMIMQVAININREDFARAARLAEETFDVAKRYGMTDRMGAVRLNQSYMSALQGKPNENYRYLMQALEIANRDPGLNELRLTALGNLAAYFLEMGRFSQGLEYSRRTALLARQMDHPSMEIVGLGNWGSAEVHLGEVDSGLQRIRDAVALAQRRGTHEDAIQTHAQLSWTYFDLGRYREAFLELRNAEKLFKKKSVQERDHAIIEVQEQHSAERKTREIQRLSLDNARRQAELEARAWKERAWAMLTIALLLLGALLYQWFRALRRRNQALEISNDLLNEQSTHDPLTGAFNRRHCEQLLNHEATLLDRASDHTGRAGMGLILIDLDHFKQINDRYGHPAGDAVLVEVTRRLKGSVRVRDVVARWGGEEFLLILPGTPATNLPTVAKSLLQVIAEQPFDIQGSTLHVTGSIGSIAWPMHPGHRWSDALEAADLALFASKKAGRNRATCLTLQAAGVTTERLQHVLEQGGRDKDVRVETVGGPPGKVSGDCSHAPL